MRDEERGREGILLLDKPPGPTSHDMVNAVRRTVGNRRVGHTGTLDPLASGLLVILVGRATKLAPFLPGDPKVYEGSMVLGLTTDTLDTQGRIVREARFGGGEEEVHAAFASLIGESEQVPPMHSAVKFQGKPLYSYARRGQEVPRRARKVRVYRADATAYRDTGTKVEVDFLISCSPGAYVREFAARVGEMLGCGAAVSSLRRLSSGPFHVAEAISAKGLAAFSPVCPPALMPMEKAVEGMKRLAVADASLRAARNGAALEECMLASGIAHAGTGDLVAVTASSGELVGFHEITSASPLRSRPLRIL